MHMSFEDMQITLISHKHENLNLRQRLYEQEEEEEEEGKQGRSPLRVIPPPLSWIAIDIIIIPL